MRLISNDTLRRCTTCCSCGQVRQEETLTTSSAHFDTLLLLCKPNYLQHVSPCSVSYSTSSVPTQRIPADDHLDVSKPPSPALTHASLSQQQRHPVLRLALPSEEEVVVSRRGRGGLARLESPPPINRYAGDWSVCGRDLLSAQEADYDEVAGSDSDGGKQMSRTLCPFPPPKQKGRLSVLTFRTESICC